MHKNMNKGNMYLYVFMCVPTRTDITTYRKTSSICRTKYQNLNVSCLALQLSLPNPLKPGVKLRMKMQLEQRRQAMLQLHLSYQQFYCLLRCDLHWRSYGWHIHDGMIWKRFPHYRAFVKKYQWIPHKRQVKGKYITAVIFLLLSIIYFIFDTHSTEYTRQAL